MRWRGYSGERLLFFERFGWALTLKLRDCCPHGGLLFRDSVLVGEGLDLKEPPFEGFGFESKLLSGFEMVEQARQFLALRWCFLEIHLIDLCGLFRTCFL